ncbi:MAG: lipopolysaccharide kinase InaA family protein [Gemmatimonadaceae bacterium]
MTERAKPLDTDDVQAPAPDYQRRKWDGIELVAHNDIIEALTVVLTRFGTLYEWARSVTQPLVLRGRAPVYVAQVPGSAGTMLVVRHAWHGGLLAPFTRDVFVRPTRAPNELRISGALRSCNIGTPELLAYALYDAGPGVVRVDVASRYIPDSYDFAVVLAGLSPIVPRLEAFVAIEALLRKLAQHRFTHPDLNVKNVLLSERNHLAVASVLDVDVMQQNPGMSTSNVMEINANRLARSMTKSREQFGVHITDEEIEAFRQRLIHSVQ